MRGCGASSTVRNRSGDRDPVQRIEGDYRAKARRREQECERLVASRCTQRHDCIRGDAPSGIAKRHRVDRIGQCVRAQYVVVVDGEPAIVPRVAPPVAQDLPVRRHTEHFVAPLRALRRVFERAGEAACFARGDVALVRPDERNSQAGDDAEDDDDDEDFDEREARFPAYRSHDPMSASTPVPPGWPSAPYVNTSTSPLRPGFRYWYEWPHGSRGSFSR